MHALLDQSTDLTSAMDAMDAVDLETLDTALLHDRVESKVVLRSDTIPGVLRRLHDDYFVLEHNASRLQGYRTEYFDSAGLRNYHEHHNQRRMRLKVRYRSYLSSCSTFFEVKRNVDGRTVKDRRRSRQPGGRLWHDDAEFFNGLTGWHPDLLFLSLTVDYERILLVKRDLTERVTIDLGMRFHGRGRVTQAEALAICEFKQPAMDRHSPAMAAVQQRPRKFSKYCMGLASCDPSLKRNRFKQNFLAIDSIGAPIVTQAVAA
jgi:hypothetical protein